MVIVAVAACVATGCGIPVDSVATDLPELVSVSVSSTSTTAAPAMADSSTTLPRGVRGVIVYFVRGDGLVGRATVVDADFTANSLLSLLVEGLIGDVAGGLRSGLEQRPELIEAVVVADGVATVDLAATFGDLPGAEQVLILGQITLTLTANIELQGVAFRTGGESVAVPGADGQPVTGLVGRREYVALLTRS